MSYLCTILDVAEVATLDQIKCARDHKLLLNEVKNEFPENERAASELRRFEINYAYGILSDPEKRQAFETEFQRSQGHDIRGRHMSHHDQEWWIVSSFAKKFTATRRGEPETMSDGDTDAVVFRFNLSVEPSDLEPSSDVFIHFFKTPGGRIVTAVQSCLKHTKEGNTLEMTLRAPRNAPRTADDKSMVNGFYLLDFELEPKATPFLTDPQALANYETDTFANNLMFLKTPRPSDETMAAKKLHHPTRGPKHRLRDMEDMKDIRPVKWVYLGPDEVEKKKFGRQDWVRLAAVAVTRKMTVPAVEEGTQEKGASG